MAEKIESVAENKNNVPSYPFLAWENQEDFCRYLL